ncbi:MAG: phosphoesterase [Candidatus Heimdallarchaeota archaeon]
MPRMVYSGDVHGSEVVWFKFLKAANEYNTDIIFMNGDLTGKKIVPISKMSNTWKTPNIFGKEWILKTEQEVQDITKRIRHIGMYPWEAPYEKVMEYAKDQTKWDELFTEIMQKEMGRWLLAVEEKVSKNVTIIVAPGNDDPFVIDEIIRNHEEQIVYPNDKVVWLDEKHPMITCEWSNPTPWNSPREEPEKELEKRLLRKFKMVNESLYPDLICAFHVPPYDSGIDMAPKLDKNLKPVLIGGHPVMIPVGSKSVRKVIEKYKPLIGLHSHIHESPGEVKFGRTICINPGSEYDRGILRMYVFDLGPEGIEKYWRITG